MGHTTWASRVHHDPRGPISVVGDIPLDIVRDACGPGAWIEVGSTHSGLALVVTTRRDLASAMADAGVPCVIVADARAGADDPAVTPDALGEWLRAFSDGAPIHAAEAEERRWLDAVRREEMAEQARARAIEVAAVREAELAEVQTREQLDRMNAHIAAMESSRAWRVARKASGLKASLRRLGRRRTG